MGLFDSIQAAPPPKPIHDGLYFSVRYFQRTIPDRSLDEALAHQLSHDLRLVPHNIDHSHRRHDINRLAIHPHEVTLTTTLDPAQRPRGLALGAEAQGDTALPLYVQQHIVVNRLAVRILLPKQVHPAFRVDFTKAAQSP